MSDRYYILRKAPAMHLNSSTLTCLTSIWGRSIHSVQWESGIAGDSKVGNRQGAKLFDGVTLRWRLGKLSQALRYEQNKINKHSISVSLDLKVAEQAVCSEQVQGFIYDIVSIWVR